MEVWFAHTLRDLGFLLYGGPMVAFAILMVWDELQGRTLAATTTRVFRAWGPGFGLSLGATVLGALSGRWLTHGTFSFSMSTGAETIDTIAWCLFFLLWLSNIQLEVWTLHPVRGADPNDTPPDAALFPAACRRLRRHVVLQACLVMATAISACVAAAPSVFFGG